MKKILIVPSVLKKRGTGHITRCLDLFSKFLNVKNLEVWFFQEKRENQDNFFDLKKILAGNNLPQDRIVNDLNAQNWDLIILDNFKTSGKYIKLLEKYLVLALDEGGKGRKKFDYILDIIPSGNTLDKNFNLYSPEFLSLPVNKKTPDLSLKKILLVIRGENYKKTAFKCVAKVAWNFPESHVTAVISGGYKNCIKPENLQVLDSIKNLKEELYKYDLLITYYGLTALEARSAGVKVLLLSPDKIHRKLGRGEGFYTLGSLNLSSKNLKKIKENPSKLLPPRGYCDCRDKNSKGKNDNGNFKPDSLFDFINEFELKAKKNCPVCNCPSPVISRFYLRTFRKCPRCNLIYQEVFFGEKMDYGKDYFFDQYKAQYGKSYLDDFQNIKSAGLERCRIIKKIIKKEKPVLLDIGCAYGPFLTAARETGFIPLGTDISEDACKYVSDVLGIPAFAAAFPESDIEAWDSGYKQFDVVSMWYVIEHFENLSLVLKKVSGLVKTGGVFCFSTPNYSGISGRKSLRDFLNESPSDHYTIWNKRSAKKILKKYGFKPVCFRYTGIHPERFPGKFSLKFADRNLSILKKIEYKIIYSLMDLLHLGDTFEVYGVKK